MKQKEDNTSVFDELIQEAEDIVYSLFYGYLVPGTKDEYFVRFDYIREELTNRGYNAIMILRQMAELGYIKKRTEHKLWLLNLNRKIHFDDIKFNLNNEKDFDFLHFVHDGFENRPVVHYIPKSRRRSDS